MSFGPKIKVICGAGNRGWAEDEGTWSDDLDRHDVETKMGSTLMVKINLNRESHDDLQGTFLLRVFVICPSGVT